MRSASIILVLITVNVFALIPIIAPAHSESLGAWSATTSYPTTNLSQDNGIQWQSCVSSSGDVYCVGGGDYYTGDVSRNVSYASLSASGVSKWQSTAKYPLDIGKESCVTSSGYIYCVGGMGPVNSTSTSSTDSVYYGQLTSSGITSWTATTDYPSSVASLSCVTDSGYVYCMAGYTFGSNQDSNLVYFAKLSSSGVGAWSSTTSYPLPFDSQACVASSGVVYCTGGSINGVKSTNSSYYASLSSSGVGPWKSTTEYPTSVTGEACVPTSGYVYCIGGMDSTYGYDRTAVYYAALSSSGIGSWVGTTGYPTPVDSLTCVADSTYVYCLGGGESNDQVFYSQIVPTNPNSATATVTSPVSNGWMQGPDYPTTIVNQACVASSGVVYCIAGDISSGGINSTGGIGGDLTGSVYYASLSSSGVGSWTGTTNYPSGDPTSCVLYSGDVYCISSSASYYATISSSGVGSWTATTRYPGNYSAYSCAASSGYVYCIGGTTSGPNGFFDLNAVFFAQLTSSGVGAWSATTPYPVLVYSQACVSDFGYIYCIGGGPEGNSAYYASVTPSGGVGTWSQTTSYPISVVGESCVVYSGYVYCINGGADSVYYAQISRSGIGSWTGTTSYPLDVSGQACTVDSGNIVCVGGLFPETPVTLSNPPNTNEVYYTSVSLLQVSLQTSKTSETATASSSNASTILFGQSQYGADLVADAYDTHNGMLYVVSFTTPGQIFVVDPSTGTIVGNITVGDNPSAIVFDPNDNDLYATISGTIEISGTNVTVISDSGNSFVTNITVGNGPMDLAFDSSNNRIYVTNGIDNTVSVVDAASNSVVATVNVGEGPLGIVADPSNGNIYVANSIYDNVSVISAANDQVVATVTLGDQPQYIAYDSSNQDIYVTSTGTTAGGLSVLQGSNNKVIATIGGGDGNFGIAFDSSNGNVYYVNQNSNTVTVVSGSTNKVVGTLETGASPLGIAFDPDNGKLYVTDVGDQTLTILSASTSGSASAVNSVSSSGSSATTSGTSLSILPFSLWYIVAAGVIILASLACSSLVRRGSFPR